jgi:hypothetical protein
MAKKLHAFTKTSFILLKANARTGLLQRATSILGVLGSTLATVLRALPKTVRMFKRCKLFMIIKSGDFSQAVSL